MSVQFMASEATRRWRMGTVVEASDTAFLKWLANYVESNSTVQIPVAHGSARFGNMVIEPPDPALPLRASVDGVIRDQAGYAYPLLHPLAVAVTPIGAGDRLQVELDADAANAQAYLVRLVKAILAEWPSPTEALWVHQPRRQEHALGHIRLKTDPAHFARGLVEFAEQYHPAAITAVRFSERSAPASENHPKSVQPNRPAGHWRRQAWDVQLHLPGQSRPCQRISDLTLSLELSRMSGRYPVMATLSQCGAYVFPEVEAFVGDFLAWCRENWRAEPDAPAKGSVAVRRQQNQLEEPWQRLPEHLWDRQAVELWWAGHSHKEIGQQLSQAPKTVRNRLTQLRKAFGPQVVPLRHDRDKLGTSG